MSKVVSIVHESEVQRQHVRLQLPLRIKLSGYDMECSDWSSSGVALSWQNLGDASLTQGFAIGQIHDAVVLFQFEGFELSMPMKLELRYLEREKFRAGFRFTNLTDQQVSLLQYVVGAYVSGEVVRAGDLIQIAGRNNKLQSRSVPSDTAGLSAADLMKIKMRKAMYSGVVAVASILALLYVITGMYERSFVVESTTAQVKADVSSVPASVSGMVFFQPNLLDAKVKKGQPLATVKTDKGNIVAIDSPCDCVVKEFAIPNQSMVVSGDSLMLLASQSAVPYVEAWVPSEQAVRLAAGDSAVLNFEGAGRMIKGKIARIKASTSGASASVTVTPSEALPVAWVDDPVDVRFDTLLFSK